MNIKVENRHSYQIEHCENSCWFVAKQLKPENVNVIWKEETTTIKKHQRKRLICVEYGIGYRRIIAKADTENVWIDEKVIQNKTPL